MKRVRRPVSPARLSSRRRLLVNATGLGLWGSGVLWLVFHYFLVRQGEFGPTANPLEPWWLKLHGALAFLAVWTGGLLWGLHVVNGWRLRRRRRSGAIALGLLLVLTVTGYLLYYAGEEGLRSAISLAHWILGLALPLTYVAHRLAERRHPPSV